MGKQVTRKEIVIDIDHVNRISGDLTFVEPSAGLVIFAHGGGSSRFSPRNRFVGNILVQHDFSTLLLDLLTEREEAVDIFSGEYRLDIDMLTERISMATRWAKRAVPIKDTPLGYFAASTGAAAALRAAVNFGDDIHAIVSSGGRCELAGKSISHIKTPTLFIVGENDKTIIEINKKAMKCMKKFSELRIVEGATHLFEEPGAMESVADNAAEWFDEYLRPNQF